MTILDIPKGLEVGSPLFKNIYNCPCGKHWDDVWDSGCDDKCSDCGLTISPTESVFLGTAGGGNQS